MKEKLFTDKDHKKMFIFDNNDSNSSKNKVSTPVIHKLKLNKTTKIRKNGVY